MNFRKRDVRKSDFADFQINIVFVEILQLPELLEFCGT